MSRVLCPQGFQQSLQPRPLLVNLLTITTFAPRTDTRASHLRPTPTPHTKDLTPTPTPHASDLTPHTSHPRPTTPSLLQHHRDAHVHLLMQSNLSLPHQTCLSWPLTWVSCGKAHTGIPTRLEGQICCGRCVR